MSNNSSNQSGWLTPLGNDPEYDDALETRLADWLQNVAGYPQGSVWPRWQQTHPTLAADTNGCLFNLVIAPADDSPAFAEQTDDGVQLWRHEIIECMASFYGPAGMQYAARFRDGICIEQNNSTLNASGLTLVNYGSINSFPEFINELQVRRHDMVVCLRRKVIREYGIKSLVETSVQFFGE